jgi:hypothetical protein
MATTDTTTAPDYAAAVQRFVDSCTTLDAMERTANEINRKALAEWARLQGLPGNLARMPKPELAKLVADTAWQLRTPEAPKAPEAPAPEAEAPEAPMAGTIEAIKAEKPTKAAKPKGAPRAPKVQLGQLPEGADEGTCAACGRTLAATKFPKAVVAGKRQANLRADECRECRDARRAGPAPVQGPEVPAAPEAAAELSAAEAAELAATDAEAQA